MCDTMVSLAESGILFAKNSDRDPNEAQIIEWHPGAQHEPGSVVAATWITIPQVARTHSILISRPWWIWGAEMGANDRGVVIGNEAVFTREPLRGEPGLLGMDLLRLALERSDDAASAVDTIVTLLTRYGQAGAHSHENPRFAYHNSFLIADPAGAIVLETAGRKWAVEEVRGRSRAISNGLTIEGFAREHSDRLRSRVVQGDVRRGVSEHRSRGARTVADMAAILRDNGTGGGPRWSLANGSMVGPNMHAGGILTSSMTASSWVSDLSTGAHHATGTADPAFSLFLPLRVDAPADLGPVPTNRFDPDTWWWGHEEFRRRAARDWVGAHAVIAAERDAIEAGWAQDSTSTAAAITTARTTYSRWSAEVGRPRDTRPLRVRRQWRKWDEAALLA